MRRMKQSVSTRRARWPAGIAPTHRTPRRGPPRWLQGMLVALAVLLATPGWALDPRQPLRELHHQRWTELEGGPAEVVSIAQTPDGFLWLATGSGLVRFDGQRFLRVNLFPDQPTRGQGLSHVLAMADGSLWLGLRTGSLAVHRLADGTLRRYGKEEGLIGNRVIAFAHDDAGAVWALTFAGLLRFDGQRWHKQRDEVGYPYDDGFSLYRLGDGRLAVNSVDGGVYLRPAAGGAFQRQTGQPRTAQQTFEADGTHWVWQQDGLLRRLPPGAPEDRWRLPASSMGNLRSDGRGNLWATDHATGLRRVRHLPGAAAGTATEVEAFSARQGLSSDAVLDLFVDRDGDLWVGTLRGLDHFSRPGVHPAPAPWDTLGPALAPSAGAGVCLISPWAQPACVTAAGDVRPQPGWPGDNGGSAVARDRQGQVWFGGQMGLWPAQPGNASQRIPWPGAPGTALPLFSFAFGPDDSLWAAVGAAGVLQRQGGRWLPRDERLPAGTAVAVAVDEAGATWIAQAEGRVLRLRGDELRRFDLPAGRVGTLQLAAGQVWVGGEFGLAAISGDQLRPVPPVDGRPLGLVMGIVQTADGSLWLNEAEGVVQVDAASLRRWLADPAAPLAGRRRGREDGLPGTLPPTRPSPSMVLADDGRLWITRTAALYWLDPQQPLPAVRPSAPVVDELQAAGRRWPLAGTGGRPAGPTVLPAGTTQLRIAYGAANLQAPDRTRYRHRLVGLESDWQPPDSRREASYTNLPPGDYVFELESGTDDPAWQASGRTTLPLRITPALHQMAAFQAGMGLAALLAGWGLWRAATRRALQRMRHRLQVQQAERERIARDLHDHLLQGTTALTLQVQASVDTLPDDHPARQRLALALDRADDALRETRARVEGLRAHADGRALLPALQVAVAEVVGGTTAQPVVAVRSSGEPRPLWPWATAELYEVALEALRNALAHAQARHITLLLHFAPDALHLTVRDDGRGLPADLDLAQGRPGHFGLRNIRERAALLRAVPVWRAAEGGGTELWLRVDAARAYAPQPRRWRWPLRRSPDRHAEAGASEL